MQALCVHYSHLNNLMIGSFGGSFVLAIDIYIG